MVWYLETYQVSAITFPSVAPAPNYVLFISASTHFRRKRRRPATDVTYKSRSYIDGKMPPETRQSSDQILSQNRFTTGVENDLLLPYPHTCTMSEGPTRDRPGKSGLTYLPLGDDLLHFLFLRSRRYHVGHYKWIKFISSTRDGEKEWN